MAVFKCKMCGATLNITNNESVIECDYCQTMQTLPKSDNEIITNLYNRANNLRLKSEFDKAEQVYEKILEVDDTEAEAHWGIVLCKYGIEYVEDPKTYKRTPTCHRTSFDVILTDSAYLSAIANADAQQKAIYEAEAKKINDIQGGILDIVKNERPFDVFICYKETDENGKRTIDSVLANDIYHQLTDAGFKVFYAAITLEAKLGHEYEPYIFSALSTSKVMLVLGTKPEYFEAVWVKNEWSRFLKMVKADRSKLLIPCYRDMDAYDLPEEFAHLQAQDMSKIGFINDVVRGIKKVIVKEEKPAAQPVYTAAPVQQPAQPTNIDPLLTRAFIFLEDGDFDNAEKYCEMVLDADPENAKAYLGKALASLRLKKIEALATCQDRYTDNKDYMKAERFADAELTEKLIQYLSEFRHNNYSTAVRLMNNAVSSADYKKAARVFDIISGYKDSLDLKNQCNQEAARIDSINSDFTNKINKRRSELLDLKNAYTQTESSYNSERARLEYLQKHSKTSRTIYITAFGSMLSFVYFLGVGIILENTVSESVFGGLLALGLVGIYSFGISFTISWLHACYKILDVGVIGIIKKLCWNMIPFAPLIVGIIDAKKISGSSENIKKLEENIQNTYNTLNNCYNRINTLEEEIRQLTNQQKNIR